MEQLQGSNPQVGFANSMENQQRNPLVRVSTVNPPPVSAPV